VEVVADTDHPDGSGAARRAVVASRRDLDLAGAAQDVELFLGPVGHHTPTASIGTVTLLDRSRALAAAAPAATAAAMSKLVRNPLMKSPGPTRAGTRRRRVRRRSGG